MVARQARKSGVSRLSNITGLDRIGLPIWQATRPVGRALSIHQGKGWTMVDAQLGALGEAIESDSAERVRSDVESCTYVQMDRDFRTVPLSLLCRDDKQAPDEHRAQDWVQMVDIRDGEHTFVPLACVSLDYTRHEDSALDRSSNGLGAGHDWDMAISKALFECIERDAQGRWLRLSPAHRLAREIDYATLPSGWNDPWGEILEAMAVNTRIFILSSVTGAPCFLCTLAPGRATTPLSLTTAGSACGMEKERTLFHAFAEAVQARATVISGARDDIMPQDYPGGDNDVRAFPYCPPAPPGWLGKIWTDQADAVGDWRAQAKHLSSAGFKNILIKKLTTDDVVMKVVKVIVPGLGSLTRRPQKPA